MCNDNERIQRLKQQNVCNDWLITLDEFFAKLKKWIQESSINSQLFIEKDLIQQPCTIFRYIDASKPNESSESKIVDTLRITDNGNPSVKLSLFNYDIDIIGFIGASELEMRGKIIRKNGKWFLDDGKEIPDEKPDVFIEFVKDELGLK